MKFKLSIDAMTHPHDLHSLSTRRQFFGRTATGIGSLALSSMLNGEMPLHFAPKAKRIIYLFMQGGPSQLDLFDPKPGLAKRHGEELPESIRQGQRLTGMTATQERFPVAATRFRFAQHGKSGAWLSELLPHMGREWLGSMTHAFLPPHPGPVALGGLLVVGGVALSQ